MQMDELTQQNAALVEEATAASQAMAQQVRGLNDMLERYRVAEQMAGAVAATTRRAEPAPASAQSPRGDRRGGSRPWSSRGQAAGAAAGAANATPKTAQTAARANGTNATDKGDTEWREF